MRTLLHDRQRDRWGGSGPALSLLGALLLGACVGQTGELPPEEPVDPSIQEVPAESLAAMGVAKVTWINADTDKDLGTLVDGAVLDLAAQPTRQLALRFDT